DAGTAAVDALLDSDPGVVDAAARTLLAEVPSLGKPQRRALANHLLELLKPRKGAGLPLASETALLRLLAALEDPRGAPILWTRIESQHAPEVRAAALQALGTLGLPSNHSELKKVLACALAKDFRVVAPALMLLLSLTVVDRLLTDWLPLLDAADVAVRRFANEKLTGKDHPGVAAALARQLQHPDRGLREDALGRLAALEHGRQALVDQLLEARSA